MQDIYLAIPIGIFLAFMIGPVFFVLLETAIIKGFRAALFFDIGVLLGDVVFLCIAYFGTNQLLEKVKDEPALFLLGGIILVVYGTATFISAKSTTYNSASFEIQKLKNKAYAGIALKGFLLNFVNIGVLGFWLGLLIIFGPSLEMHPKRLVVFFSSILLTYFLVDLLKILIAKRLNSKLTPIRVALAKKVTAIIIVIFGFSLFFKGVFPDYFESLDTRPFEDYFFID